MAKVALVVAVLNGFEEFTELVASAKTYENELRIYPQLQNRHQVPLAKAWNNGIREAINDGCEYIIVSNDDVLFAPFTIDEMVKETRSALTDYRKDKIRSDGSEIIKEPVLFAPLDVSETFDDPLEIIWSKKSTEFKFREQELFSCVMITPRTIEKVGWFDENFDPAWHEDTDYHQRCFKMNYGTVKFQIPYIHRGSITTKKLTRPLNSMRGQQYYVKKWGSYTRDAEKEGELFNTPYNRPDLTCKDWIPNYGG